MTKNASPPKTAQAAIAVIALLCIAPSASINVVHVLGHTPGALGVPLALASVVSVMLAAASPFAIERAIAGRNVALLAIALLTGAVCLSYNLSVAVGAASTTRSETTGARTAENQKAALLTGQLVQAEKSRVTLASIAQEKTPGVIAAELRGLEQSAAWTSSKQCSDATLPTSRTFCAEHAGRQAALDAAKKVEALDIEIAATKAALLKSGPATGQAADPQSANIAAALSFIGVTVEVGNIGIGLNLWLAVLVEIVGAFGPLVFAAALRREDGTQKPEEAATAAKAAKKEKSQPKRKAAQKPRSRSKKASQAADVLSFGEPLAERQRRVAELKAEGKTQLQIAADLGVSRATVQRLTKAS